MLLFKYLFSPFHFQEVKVNWVPLLFLQSVCCVRDSTRRLKRLLDKYGNSRCVSLCVFMHLKFSPAPQGMCGQDLTGSRFKLIPSHKELPVGVARWPVCVLWKNARKGGVSFRDNMPLMIFRKKQSSERETEMEQLWNVEGKQRVWNVITVFSVSNSWVTALRHRWCFLGGVWNQEPGDSPLLILL